MHRFEGYETMSVAEGPAGKKQSEDQTPGEKQDDQPPKRTRKRRWGPPLPPEQVDLRKRQAAEKTEEQKQPPVHEDELSFKRFRGFRRGRSSSSCREREYKFETKHKETWRCLVCYLWNDNELYDCARCGTPEGGDKADRYGENRFDTAFANYRSGHSDRPGTPPKAVEWPPTFETHGSEYIFDIRSEMFYEPNSDCFYDPKSKLYYSNQKQAYYRHDKDAVPPFTKVTEASRAKDDNEMVTVKSEGSTSSKSKKSIQISIKSTEDSLAGSRVGTVDFRAAQQQMMKPPVAAVVARGGQTQTQISDSSDETLEKARLQAARDNARAAVAAQGRGMGEIVCVKEKTLKTASGKPICTLCRRKFPSLDILRRHEKESELHKKNLMKQAALNAAKEEKPKDPPVVYTDRASKRRQMHGEGLSIAPPRPTFVLKETTRPPAVAQPAVLGQDNVGHQLFQKMMGDAHVPVRGAMEESLRRDWDRVEAMSNSGSNSSSKPGLSSSNFKPSGNGYKWK